MLLALVPPSTGTLFTQSFTPTCSPTAALGPFRTNKVFTPTQTKTALLGPKNLFKLLTATQNRTGLLNKATAHGGFVATLSSSGAFSKGLLYARQFAATLFGGSGGGSPAIDDTYSETNRSNSKLINPPVTVAFGQTFTSSGGTLVQVRFYLFNTGSTTGNATVSLYALSGGLPTGSALATSDPFDTSTLTGFPAQAIDFAFSGVNQYSMVAATSYAIVINFAGANLNVEVDDTSPKQGSLPRSVSLAGSGNCHLKISLPRCSQVVAADLSWTIPTVKLIRVEFSPSLASVTMILDRRLYQVAEL
jgi:hypothetical protein